MKKYVVAMGVWLTFCGADLAYAQGSSAIRTYGRPTLIGTVRISRSVMADGKPLAAGTYQVHLSTDPLQPAVGQSPGGERFVEFRRGEKVVAREVATVIFEGDVASVAKGRRPRLNSSTFEMLKGGDYWRVWINRDGTNYLINLPPGT
jgi:hypothetical protein